MKKLILATFVLVFALSACERPFYDGKNVEDREYEFNGFTGIDVSDAMEVEVIPAARFRITATGHEKDLEKLVLKVRNNQLIAQSKGMRWLGRKIKLYIELPEIKEINLAGATTARVYDFNNTKSLKIDLSGASELMLNIPTEEIIGELSGASELEIKKETQQIELELSGASSLFAFEANALTSYLDLSGASDANISVKDYLNIVASGASSVRYKGTPKVDQKISGSSKVTKAQ